MGGLADVLASSGEVHGVLGIIVDLNCLGQCLGVPAITLTRHVTAFSAARQRKAGFTFTVGNVITSQMQETEGAGIKTGIRICVLVCKRFSLMPLETQASTGLGPILRAFSPVSPFSFTSQAEYKMIYTTNKPNLENILI